MLFFHRSRKNLMTYVLAAILAVAFYVCYFTFWGPMSDRTEPKKNQLAIFKGGRVIRFARNVHRNGGAVVNHGVRLIGNPDEDIDRAMTSRS